MEDASTSSSPEKSPTKLLTVAQQARIESNRQRAVLLKQSRQKSVHPYARNTRNEEENKSIIRVEGVKFIDTKGGFLLEHKDGEDSTEERRKIVEDPAPIIEPDWPTCEECKEKFMESYLMEKFDLYVCNNCRDDEGLHRLITKTDAKNEYLLKDCDLEKREPPLKYLTRTNPHDARWGSMKLYLQIQIEKRALEVWGSEENIEEERERRDAKKEKSKEKKYQKKLKELRMSVRSSLYNKVREVHEHDFGPEQHVEEDTYTRKCTTCKFTETYEKM